MGLQVHFTILNMHNTLTFLFKNYMAVSNYFGSVLLLLVNVLCAIDVSSYELQTSECIRCC